MRPSRHLKYMAQVRGQVRQMNLLHRVIMNALEQMEDVKISEGNSDLTLSWDPRYMPYESTPVIGFTPER